MASKKLQGRIIRILDTRTVIINLGNNDGIKGDSIFSILGEPEPVIDSFSLNELGLVSIVKAKVKASQIHDKFTIATTKWSSTYLKASANIGAQISTLFDTQVVDQGELRVDPEEIKPWKAISEVPVKVGDIVEVDVAEPSPEVAERSKSGLESESQLPPSEGLADATPSSAE